MNEDYKGENNKGLILNEIIQAIKRMEIRKAPEYDTVTFEKIKDLGEMGKIYY